MHHLMPTTVKGANVFHPSLGHTSAILELENNGEGDGGSDSDDDGNSDGKGKGIAVKQSTLWSSTLPPNDDSSAPPKDHTLTALSFAPGHKRKHAALSAFSPATTTATTSTSSASSGPK